VVLTPTSTPTTAAEITSVSSSSSTSTSASVGDSTTSPSSVETTGYVPPTVIVVPPTSTVTGSTTQQTSGPTQLPQVISPANGVPNAPENSTLVQFGFNNFLKWSFVAATANSSAQILYYIPLGVQYALEIAVSEVSMYALVPYDTQQSLGYETTLAQFYIPSDQVEPLGLELHARNSRLYQQQDPSIKTLFDMINAEIPLVVGQPTGSGSSTSGSVPGTSGTSANAGNPTGGGNSGDAGASSSGNSVRGSSAAIGAGAAVGAAAYAAAMFYVARRYRKRRQLHQRSSSVPSASPSEGGHASLFQTLSPNHARISHNSGQSNRTAMISAPVMAENSLGWN
jgi:hypothetical protein